MFSTRLDNFLPFSSNLKSSSANSFSLEESKILSSGNELRQRRLIHMFPVVQVSVLKPNYDRSLSGSIIVRIYNSQCNRTHSSLNICHCIAKFYKRKQPKTRKECCTILLVQETAVAQGAFKLQTLPFTK